MKRAMLWIVAAGLAASMTAVRAYDTPANKKSADTSKKATEKQAYVGVEVEALTPVIWSQMPDIVPKGQGILVMFVNKDSPADKAGMKPDDILLSFGEQKVYSPEQFVKLVQDDKPGQQIGMTLIRGGKSVSSKVTLGEREISKLSANTSGFQWIPDERLRGLFEKGLLMNDNTAWDSFDALKLTRLDKNRWHAEIEYRSKDGKKEDKTFEGTRDEIHKDIQTEKNLPAEERTRLLRALDIHEPILDMHIPGID